MHLVGDGFIFPTTILARIVPGSNEVSLSFSRWIWGAGAAVGQDSSDVRTRSRNICLREDLGEDDIEALDDVRAFLADGWTYTETDLREHLVEAGDEDTLNGFDRGRGYFDLARTPRLLMYLPVLLILIVVGFLGGRGWSGRFAWAAGSLAVTSAIILVAFGPVYSAVSESLLEDARGEVISDVSGDFEITQRLFIDKLFDIGELAIDGFGSDIFAGHQHRSVGG